MSGAEWSPAWEIEKRDKRIADLEAQCGALQKALTSADKYVIVLQRTVEALCNGTTLPEVSEAPHIISLAQSVKRRLEKAEHHLSYLRMQMTTWGNQSVADVRAQALEEAAKVAETYEPHCDSCPRGVVSAILNLKERP